ncbi:C39 family peptidase [Azospirillum soli]|uniref:C39 family peptidase n=1 Tax=Azospirillum soli TaxID=1304799 RepID=UPI001AE5F1ED|nr:C39 family peptidase [Azospirillum soli]MBP2314493.1 putative double-glycine peptidase [Azospirillum soli]
MLRLRTFLRGAAMALSLLALGAAPAMGAAQKFLRMPDVRQVGEDGAGIAALQAVFAYYGLDGRQDVLRQRLTERGSSPNDFRQIVRVANEYGLKATVMSKMTEQQLRDQISKGFPVIVAVQAWIEGGGTRSITDWARRKENGHWLVALGYDDMAFYFEDPAIFGIGAIRRDVMPFRWHDYDAKGNRLEHVGIVVEGPSPGRYDPSIAVPID